MTPEGKIEAYLKKRVLAAGGRIRKLSWPGHRGAPDRMIWYPPALDHLSLRPDMVFVEVKAPGKRATKQQSREICKLIADGFPVYVVNCKEDVERLLRDRNWLPRGKR